jgi:hypothetical protein
MLTHYGIASNLALSAADIKPAKVPVAKGITALVPSDDTISTDIASTVPIDRSVVTLVTLALLAATSEANASRSTARVIVISPTLLRSSTVIIAPEPASVTTCVSYV